ncbi:MAG: toll/interleukin-1 receptor domain-containing protein [Acidimicrobiales bacterium]
MSEKDSVTNRSSTVPRVFVSYRREDSAGYAGRLYEELVGRFGHERVFMDIDSLAPGIDFEAAIEETLPMCDTTIIVIGRAWLNVAGSDGHRRLDNANDFVRLETERSLSSSRRVIPVLVGGAEMPAEAEMPASIAGLARRHCVELSDRRWRADTKDLIDAIEHGWSKQQVIESEIAPIPHIASEPGHAGLWDQNGEVAKALAAIVTFQGPTGLFDESSVAELLNRLMPAGMPRRECQLVLAASRRNVAQEINQCLSRGLGLDEAVRTISSEMYEQEPFDQTACDWVTRAFADALVGALRTSAVASAPPMDSETPASGLLSEDREGIDVEPRHRNDAHRWLRIWPLSRSGGAVAARRMPPAVAVNNSRNVPPPTVATGGKRTKRFRSAAIVIGFTVLIIVGAVALAIHSSNDYPNAGERALLAHLNGNLSDCHRYSGLSNFKAASAGVECSAAGIDMVYMQFPNNADMNMHFSHLYHVFANGLTNPLPVHECLANTQFYAYQSVTRTIGNDSLTGLQVCFPAAGVGGYYKPNGPEFRIGWTSPDLHILAWADGTDRVAVYGTWESVGGPCPTSDTTCLNTSQGNIPPVEYNEPPPIAMSN